MQYLTYFILGRVYNEKENQKGGKNTENDNVLYYKWTNRNYNRGQALTPLPSKKFFEQREKNFLEKTNQTIINMGKKHENKIKYSRTKKQKPTTKKFLTNKREEKKMLMFMSNTLLIISFIK